MRRAFVETLRDLAAKDPRIVLLTGDLGFMALEPFSEAHPDRFFNVGVAEQNMVGMATGLAEAGFIPYVYSIVNFAVLRPFEFIRNGPIAQKLPVRIVSIGGGLEYGHNGISHYGLEDVGVMRTQPGMTIVCPCDSDQTRTAIRATIDLPGMVYFRLGKNETNRVPRLDGRFELGRVQVLREGGDILIVAMGPMVFEALEAARDLESHGFTATVLGVSSFHPSATDELAFFLKQTDKVIALESHYVTGGLGSWISEVVAEYGLGNRVFRCGVGSAAGGVTGSQNYMQHLHRIAADDVTRAAIDLLGKTPV